MIKTLQEIQEENRRLILEAIHGVSYGEALRKEIEFAGWSFDEEKDLLEHNVFTYCFKVTLNRVLLALEKQFKNEYHKMIFQDGRLFFICLRENAIQFYWDLTEETIEEQVRQTQISINKLLTEEHGNTFKAY